MYSQQAPVGFFFSSNAAHPREPRTAYARLSAGPDERTEPAKSRQAPIQSRSILGFVWGIMGNSSVVLLEQRVPQSTEQRR